MNAARESVICSPAFGQPVIWWSASHGHAANSLRLPTLKRLTGTDRRRLILVKHRLKAPQTICLGAHLMRKVSLVMVNSDTLSPGHKRELTRQMVLIFS